MLKALRPSRSMPVSGAVARFYPALLLALVSALLLACANEKSDCEKNCTRFAACKAAKHSGGEVVLGEAKPPVDPACLRKCEKQPDIFAVCEGRLKDCDEMLACSGSLRW